MSYQDTARKLVFDHVISEQDKSDPETGLTLDGIYVVWFCKTLQNWKALISTTLPDQMYYEVTYNGDKEETYIDAYKKWKNVKVSDGTE